MAWGKNQAALSEPVGIGLEFSACLIAIILRGVGATSSFEPLISLK